MTDGTSSNKGMNMGLWVSQILLATAFGIFGMMKATQPIDQLAEMMKWVPTMPPAFVRTLGVLEVLGAVGLLLPSLTRIKPRLTVIAALCIIVLQILAMGLHIMRGEAEALGLNAILIALAAFILWGRSKKSVIVPRA
jgi:uncharacterized membrane protein